MRFGTTDKNNPILAVTVMTRGRLAIPIKQDGAYKRYLNYRTGGWSCNSALLLRRNRTFAIQVVFTKTTELKEPTEFKNIVTVDVGSTNLATVVVYSPAEKRVLRSFYLGRDVAPRQRIFERRRAAMQSYGRIKKLRNDQSNFTKTRVHQIAHQILDIAKEYDGCLAVEDLDGSTDIHYTVKANRKIHRIPTRLGEVIGRVGIENGVPMLVENPAYTSRDCPKCGNRHKVSGREYRCPECGWTVNRDVNAGWNIALRATNHFSRQDMVFGQKPRSRVAVTPPVRSDDGCVVTSSQLYRPPVECPAPEALTRGFASATFRAR
jgi:IS605 OrfB family transposase